MTLAETKTRASGRLAERTPDEELAEGPPAARPEVRTTDARRRGRDKSPRICGVCTEAGHNAQTCPWGRRGPLATRDKDYPPPTPRTDRLRMAVAQVTPVLVARGWTVIAPAGPAHLWVEKPIDAVYFGLCVLDALAEAPPTEEETDE